MPFQKKGVSKQQLNDRLPIRPDERSGLPI